ncbi:helicase-related protein [Pyxidicoccus sp. 3LFB2]
MKVRDALEELSNEALRRLCEVRDLPYGRTVGERRSSLARSYRGDFEQLIHDLRREDLLQVLEGEWSHEGSDRLFSYSNLARGTRDQLEALARRHLIEDWEPSRSNERPVRGAPFEAYFLEDEDLEGDWERPGGIGEDALTEEEYVGGPEYQTEEHRRQFWEEMRYQSSGEWDKRDYQRDAIRAALAGLDAEQPKLLHVATGGGKTFIANDALVQHTVRTTGWVLWVTKDWRLLYQAARDLARRHEGFSRRLRRLGGDQSILYPLPTGWADSSVVYTTLHTLNARLADLKRARATPALIVWDECHWAESGTLGRKLLRWAQDVSSPILGLTATPRAEEDSHFEPVFHMDFATLVDKQYLARPIPHEPLSTGVEWNARRAGRHLDFTGDSLRSLAGHRKRNAFIVDHYVQHQQHYGKTILFACTVEHANTLASMLTARGVPARPIHSHLDGRVNDDALRRFREDEVQVLTNVAMLTHGTDVPDARTVFLCRPTLSDILYAQMVGRAARRDKRTQKDAFHIVEFVDLSAFRDQLVNAKRYFSGAGSNSSGDVRTSSGYTSPRRPVRLGFDPTGAPTWIADRPEVPEALRGLWYRQNQSFGLEFEFTSDTYSDAMSTQEWTDVAEPLRAALARALPPGTVADNVVTEHTLSGAGTKNYNVWNVEPDSSCGWEVTSRVLVNEPGFREVVTACGALSSAAEELGLRVNYKTGLHVHLGWLGKTPAEVKRAVLLAKWFEPAAATLVGPSRVVAFDGQSYDLGEPNSFCQPVATVFPKKRLSEASTLEDLLGQVDEHEARYVTFNIRPLDTGMQTVEVRMHGGTMDPGKTLLWVSLWMQVLWAAANHLDVPAPPDVSVIEPSGDILSLAQRYLPAVQQPLFLKRLDARRREVAASWARNPALQPWTAFATRWGTPL